MDAAQCAEQSLALSARIKPLLAGKHPAVQAGALADLVSVFLAGHFVAGDAAATAALRQELLDEHVRFVKSLVPASEREIASGRA